MALLTRRNFSFLFMAASTCRRSIIDDVAAGKVVSLAQSHQKGGYDAALNLHDQLVLAALDNGHAATARAMVMYRPYMLNELLLGAVLENDAQRVKENGC